MLDEFRGKWRVVECTKHVTVDSGLTYDDAVKEAIRLSNDSYQINGEPARQYDVEPMRRRKS